MTEKSNGIQRRKNSMWEGFAPKGGGGKVECQVGKKNVLGGGG